MRADNSHHIVTAARRRAAATRRRAVAAIRRMDNAGQPISFDAVAREAQVSRSWLYNRPIFEPRSNDSASVEMQGPPSPAFPTGNAPPTHRYDADSRSRPNEIASWKPRTGTYAKRSGSRWVNSELPRSSASSATRRQGNLNQS